jgi:hypothetical protein
MLEKEKHMYMEKCMMGPASAEAKIFTREVQCLTSERFRLRKMCGIVVCSIKIWSQI